MNGKDTPVALITGASRGLGAVLAEFLAGQGYDLVITARGAADLDKLRVRLAGFGGRVIAVAGDVTEAAHRTAALEAAKSLGGLDVLVNNASDLGALPMPHLAVYPLDALRAVLEVNLVAPLALAQEALSLLQARSGLIVNISSDAAKGGYAGWGGYGMTKAALDLVSLTLANELTDVAVVSVDPGDMRTVMHQAAFPGEDISDRPLPSVTLPFWAWLFGQERAAISGGRYQAQSEHWQPVHAANVEDSL
jgi:NAD(P)-dependent dehydrogenase (short-subunit alcohol dehydrogenase family)